MGTWHIYIFLYTIPGRKKILRLGSPVLSENWSEKCWILDKFNIPEIHNLNKGFFSTNDHQALKYFISDFFRTWKTQIESSSRSRLNPRLDPAMIELPWFRCREGNDDWFCLFEGSWNEPLFSDEAPQHAAIINTAIISPMPTNAKFSKITWNYIFFLSNSPKNHPSSIKKLFFSQVQGNKSLEDQSLKEPRSTFCLFNNFLNKSSANCMTH